MALLQLVNITAYRDPCRQCIGIYITRREGDQLQLLNGPDTFSVIEPHAALPQEPTMELTEEIAQTLCDALARQGIRPSTETRAEQKATQAHLDDLRRIAFKGLGIEGDSS